MKRKQRHPPATMAVPARPEPEAAADRILADGIALHRAGRLSEAARLYEQVLEREPSHADSRHLLGVIAYQTGNNDTAIVLIRSAIAIRRDIAAYHSNLGNALQKQGQLNAAAACFRRAIAIQPDYPEAHNNLGQALSSLGRREEAVVEYRRATGLRPDYANAYNNLGGVLLELKRLDEAVAACRKALDIDPDFAAACNTLGSVLRHSGHLDDAIGCYRQAIGLKPDYADVYNNLGLALQSKGQFAEAFAAHQAALRSGADRPAAYYGLSGCRKFTPDDLPLVADMEAALADPALSPGGRSLLNFALGKIRDDLADYAAAIQHFDIANRLGRENRPRDPARLAKLADRAIERSLRPLQADFAVSASKLPIFIVGMPRSGTTLTEQILASHPKVATGGEIDFWLRHSARSDASERSAVRDYLDLLAGLSFGAHRVIDKMPFNFLLLGDLRRLLPNARIIHCRRHPVDTALSIYFTRFADSADFAWASDYAYDRKDIVRSYLSYLRLMEHWRAVLPTECFLEIDYDHLVADQESVTRRLLAFCGLEWDGACLDFPRRNHPIGTASAWQARQPIYRGSVDRWRNYEPWLEGFRDLLT